MNTPDIPVSTEIEACFDYPHLGVFYLERLTHVIEKAKIQCFDIANYLREKQHTDINIHKIISCRVRVGQNEAWSELAILTYWCPTHLDKVPQTRFELDKVK